MIIEQVDALKVWLTNKLSPICDAEPSALAKYVCALVKKDKHEQDLRDICVDQLDVFLQQNTKPFVDELFEVLKSKIYIPPATEPKPRPPPPIPVAKTEIKSPSHQAGKEKDDGLKKKVSEISSTTDDKENKDTSLVVTTPVPTTTTTLPSAKEPAVEPKAVKDPPREVREPRATSRDARDKERDEDSSRDRRESWKEDRSREGIRDTRDGLRDSRDGNKETRDGVRDARDGIRDARDGIRDARDGIRDARDGFRDSRDGIKDGINHSRDGIKDGINHSRDGIRDSRDGVRDARDGVKDPREGTRDAKDGIRESRDGNRDFRDGNRDFRDGHRDFRDGIRDTKDGIRESRDGLKDSRDGVKDARDGVKDARDGVKDARDGVRDGIRDARDIIRDRERDKLDLKQDTREVREPRDRDYRDRDRDFRRRRTRSRSYSPRRRDFDADRRRRFEERPRYSPDRRWGRRRSYSRSPRRNRSPFDRNIVRPRSRSPRLRSRSPRDRYRPFRSRTRSRTHSRSPRPRSWSRPGSGARARTKSPSNTRLPDSRGSTPLQDNDFISSSTNDLPPTVTSIVGYRPQGEDRGDGRLPVHFDGPPPSFVQGGRVHCQNFEEKGFCTLGDDCPFDHGPDPVVVENMSLPNVLPGTSNTGGFVPPDMRVPPPGHVGVRINVQRPPPPLVEPYMPEAPGLKKLPFMHLPPPVMVPNRPPPPEHFYVPSREVIMNHPAHLEEGDLLDMVNAGPDKEPSRIVIPAKRPYSAISGDSNAMNIGPPPPRMALVNHGPLMFENPPMLQPPFPPQMQAPPRRSFDYNRLGMRARLPVPRPQFRPGNLTLEVRKVPHEFNNIAKLNEHFGKFGNLTNIQVKFQGDPGAALITFSNSSEANAAYRSPEPVFNNRFIKLFWHNAEKHINLDGETESPVVVTVGEDGRNVQIQQTTVTGGRVGDGIDHPSLMLPVRPSIPPAHKLQLDNTKAKTNSTVSVASDASTTTPSPTTDKSIVYTSSIGNLKKTVFNPAATANIPAKSKTNAPIVSPTAVKTADHVSRMEAISRAEEERKLAAIKQAELEQKKQELLAKQIQQQKILLDTLEKKKATMSEEEKKDLWKALRTISDAIDKVKYGTGAKRPQPSTFQPPVPDQFKYVSSHEQQVVHYGRGRGWPGSRTLGWNQRGRGHMTQFLSRTHLDNRPKTIEVKGFELSELEEIKQHFQRFGEIDKVDVVEVVPSIFLTYASRPSAEVAVSQGGKFKKKTLIVRWNQVTPKITRTESNQSSELDEDLSITLGSLNEDSLADAGGEDKSEEVSSSLFTSATPQEKEKDLCVLEEQSPHTGEDLAVRAAKPVFERSLSEDLLATGEEHFKASYTDDDDEEDHITVTLSNVISSAPPPYSSNSSYSSSTLLGQEAINKDIMEEEHNSGLDYSDDGPWV